MPARAITAFVLFLVVFGGCPAAFAETVTFRAAPVNPTPFMMRQAQLLGTVVSPRPGDMITGELSRPDGRGPFPAIVALHGCAGWSRIDREREAADFTARGYVFLAVDSFGPRGIAQACVPPPGTPTTDRIGDAYGALDWLSGQSFVDAARVALLGFSQGGAAALYAVSANGAAQGFAHRFAAAVTYYPACTPDSAIVTVPLLVLIGERDDWTPAVDCRSMVARSHVGGPPETLVVFPGVSHGFNLEALRDHPLDQFGHHLEYNAPAAQAADKAMFDFLAVALRR